METVARSLYEQVCSERDLLSMEVEYLRGQLADEDIVFPSSWHMSRSERLLMRGLMRRSILTREGAMALLYSGRGGDEPGDKILDVFICRLRRTIESDGIRILNRHGEGFYLTAAMKARVLVLCEREALKALGRAGAA